MDVAQKLELSLADGTSLVVEASEEFLELVRRRKNVPSPTPEDIKEVFLESIREAAGR